VNDPLHAVVIGAGLGGLAAAIRLLKRGYRVTLVERLPDPGGRARVLEHDGVRYDAGPTVITAPSLLRELFALHGESFDAHVELLPVQPWYRMQFQDESVLDVVADQPDFQRALDQFEAGAGAAFARYLAFAERLYAKGYVELGDRPFLTFGSMLKVLPDLVRLRADRSVYSLVSRYFRDERLRRAFSVPPLLVGGHPHRTTSILSLIHPLERREGVWFARGGTGAIVTALCGLIERHGGRFRYGERVARIEARDGAAQALVLERGERIETDVVVANADPETVSVKLLGRAPARRARWSMGLAVWYFETRGRWPALAHHTILFGESFRELLDDIFDARQLNLDLSLYLHRPSATDSAICPPDRDVFYVLAPVPNLTASIDYVQVAPRLRERLIEILEARALPGLRDRLLSDTLKTPEYFKDALESPHGAGFSLAPTLTQCAGFRWPNRDRRVRNLYYVGAGTHPGAGVPGVLTSAKVLERLL
jgi:phytoene desaturase